MPTDTPTDTPKRPPGYRRRQNAGGAPKLNFNRRTHGMTSELIARVSLNRLPVAWRQAGKQGQELRRSLEQQVEQLRGEVTRLDSLTINRAVRWEIVAGLAMRWLREKHDSLSPADLLNFVMAFGKATDRRDAAVEALNLPKPSSDPTQDTFRMLRQRCGLPGHATIIPPDDPEAVPDDLVSPATTPGDAEGT